jgi:hypothetical protein
LEQSIGKAILLVAETLLTAIILMLIFTTYRSNQKLDQSRMTQSSQMQIEQLHEELMQYTGATLTGSDVRNLIRDYRDVPVCITVDNGLVLQSYNYEDDLLEDLQTDEDFAYLLQQTKIYGTENYIDPLDEYHCSVTEDNLTGTVTELIFEKEETDFE